MFNLRTVGWLTLLKLIGLLFGVVYYIFQVQYLGIGRTIETYFVALALTSFVLSLTLAGQVGQLLLPLYHDFELRINTQKANQVFSVVINWMIILAIPLLLFFFVISPFLINTIVPGFNSEDQNSVLLLFRVMIFSSFFQMVNIFFDSFLNVKKVYGRAEAVTIFRTLIGILSLVFFYETLGVWALVLSLWIEHLLNFIINLFLLPRVSFRYYFQFSTTLFDHRSFFKKAASAYVLVGSGQIYQLVFTAAISFLSPGIYAVYKYVGNIFIRIENLILSPSGTVFFTSYSEAVSKKSQNLNLLFKKAWFFNFIFSSIAILLTISFGENLLQFLWADKYQSSNKMLAYIFLTLYMVTLLLNGISNLFLRVILVKGKAGQLYVGQGIVWLFLAIFTYYSIPNFQAYGLGMLVVLVPFLITMFYTVLIAKYSFDLLKAIDLKIVFRLLMLSIPILIVGYYLNEWIDLNIVNFSDRLNSFVNLASKSLLLIPLIILAIRFLGIRLSSFDPKV